MFGNLGISGNVPDPRLSVLIRGKVFDLLRVSVVKISYFSGT